MTQLYKTLVILARNSRRCLCTTSWSLFRILRWKEDACLSTQLIRSIASLSKSNSRLLILARLCLCLTLNRLHWPRGSSLLPDAKFLIKTKLGSIQLFTACIHKLSTKASLALHLNKNILKKIESLLSTAAKPNQWDCLAENRVPQGIYLLNSPILLITYHNLEANQFKETL